ncbi:MAG: FGGY family carbohydrate kinase [Firmicutes bacterium]|nr:FGGY family carbohydrate kinase [Bacillota bacterium]
MLFLGIDAGTTGAKAALFDERMALAGAGFREYGILYSEPRRAEQDANEVWRTLKDVIRRAVGEKGKEVRAISLSVQGDAVVPVDKSRKPLSLVQLGMDYRAEAEAQELEERLGGYELFEMTGMRPHPLNSLVKMMWWVRHRPDISDKLWKFMTYSDYLLCMLGADEAVIDLTMASRTMAMDINAMDWSKPILRAAGVNAEWLSGPVPPGLAVGKVRPGLAGELGFSKESPPLLVSGGHDQCCAALGAGVTKEGMALDSHGSAEVLSAALPHKRLDREMYEHGYPCYAFVVPERFFTFALNHTAGVLLKWYVENFCGADENAAKKSGVSLYRYAIDRWGGKPTSLRVLPYFNGSGTPRNDRGARGLIAGLTLNTGRFEIAGAVLEALAFELRLNRECMERSGIPIRSVRCAGGGAGSPIGLQLKADVLGVPVHTLKTREAACAGAAVLAAAGAGAFASFEDGASMAGIDRTFEPRGEYQRLYGEKYAEYENLYRVQKEYLRF